MLDCGDFVLGAMILLSLTSMASADSDITGQDYTISGDYIMGREHTTTFDYTIEVEYQAVDTALQIDNSGSMNNVIGDVKDAAKSYVDNTNTANGDENAVGILDEEIQSLTTSKYYARQAIDDTTDYGGNSCIACGVRTASDTLSEGTNPKQVMILLADAQSSEDPGDAADTARSNGIDVHGIMFSGADTGKFESLTDADECVMDESENSDGDNCWYGTTGTIGEVYASIREETETEREVDLHIKMPPHARYLSGSPDNIEAGGTREYVFEGRPTDSGSYSFELPWRPTDQGNNLLMKTGDSYIEFTEDGETSNHYFDQTQSSQVDYVDFNVFDSSVKRENGEIDVSVSVRNDGNTESRETDFRIYDGSGNSIDENLPPLSPGEEKTYTYTLDGSHPVYSDADMIRAKADATGIWGSDGKELEPVETNNVRKMGYPADPTDISPENIEYGEELVEQISLAHPEPSSLYGRYNLTVGDNGYESEYVAHENRDYASTGSTTSTYGKGVDRAESYYNFTNKVYDSYGSKSFFNYSIFVENPLPRLIDHTPEDNGYTPDYPVDIGAVADDENDDSLKVYLFNNTDGHLLHKEEISAQGSVSAEWEVPESPSDYELNITLEDRWDNYTEIVDFRKIIGGQYRSNIDINKEYTSIVMSTNEIHEFYITSSNRIGAEKNMNISLSNVNAEFGNGKGYKEINLEGYETEESLVRVMPEETGERTLEVISENTDIGLNTTREIPIYVRGPSAGSAPSEASGIGILHVFLLTFLSTLVFYWSA